MRGSVSCGPKNGWAETRASGAVPELACSSAFDAQHLPQKIWPHWRQWCLRVKKENSSPQRMQLSAASSGSHSAVSSAFARSGVHVLAPGGTSGTLRRRRRPSGCGASELRARSTRPSSGANDVGPASEVAESIISLRWWQPGAPTRFRGEACGARQAQAAGHCAGLSAARLSVSAPQLRVASLSH